MNSANAKFSEEDNSFSPVEIPTGICGISIVTKRGEIGKPTKLTKSWPEFIKRYGGLLSDNDGPLQAKILLDGGAQLRVNSIRHYTDITTGAIDAVYADVNATNGGINLNITGAPSVGNYTLSATGYTSATVPFNLTGLQTLKDLVAKFYGANKIKLAKAQLLTPTKILLAPSYGNTLSSVDITGTGVTVASVQLGAFTNGTQDLFLITPKAPGLDYNKLVVDIKPASNNNALAFDMTVWIQGEENNAEQYTNLKIDGPFVEADLSFLNGISESSELINADYVDLTGISPLTPLYGARTFTGGTNGSPITDADFIGDSAGKTGWYAFNGVDDIVSIGAPTESSTAVIIAGAAYAANRQDLVHFAHLSNTLTTEGALVNARSATLIDSSYNAFFAGGIRVPDPLTGKELKVSELGAVMALAAKSGVTYGMNKSFAGENRGVIFGSFGPVTNFGTSDNQLGMNQLSNAQINTVIAADGKVMLWNCLTSQIDDSLLSFLNVRRALIYIKGSLRATMRRYIEEDNIISTWKKLYLEVNPFLKNLADSNWFFPSKAMPLGYRWEGDQNAKDLDSLVINNKVDVLKGKYKARLFVTPTPALREIEIVVTIMGSSISVEEILGAQA